MNIRCSYDKLVLLKNLTPHPQNPNKHSQAQVKRLAKIISATGWRKPIVVSKRSGFITSGHGRLLTAQYMGLQKVPVNFQDYDDEAQEYADLVADNAAAAWAELDMSSINEAIGSLGPDFDVDLLGINGFTIEVADRGTPAADEAPPLPKRAKTKAGELWLLGDHRLLCGDATAPLHVERLLGDVRPDMVFTDPPYGIAHSGKGIKGAAKGNDFGEILGDKDITVATKALKLCQGHFERATLIFWGANYYPAAIPNGFGWIVWDKQREGEMFSGAELAFVNRGARVKLFRHQWHGMIKASEHGAARVHPTQKPIALAEWCFEQYGKPKTVLDLFGGSGTTMMACEKTSRRCFMMELDPRYVDVIITRWAALTGKDPVRSDGARWSGL